MDYDMSKKILEDSSLEELSEIVRFALSTIYCKLREEKGFGYNLHCSVTEFGSDPSSVNLIITENIYSSGEQYIQSYWI